MTSSRWPFAALIQAALLSLSACGGSSSSPTTGTITATITAASGVAIRVEVSGPGGYAATLTATQVLSGLGAGDYTFTARPARRAGTFVDELHVAAPATVALAAGGSGTAQLTYTLRPGTGQLWLPIFNDSKVNGYSVAQLATGGDGVTPDRAIGLGSGNRPYSGAIAPDGTLWVGTQLGTLLAFDAAHLGGSGTPTPLATIASGTTDLNGLAFDGHGNLWVATATDVRAFSASALAASGSPAPSVVIAGTASSPLTFVSDLAFDAGGDLWVVVPGSDGLYKYAASQLLASGAPEPAVVISAPAGGSLNQPYGVAFDGAGALWVVNSSSQLFKYVPAQLVSSGAPVPSITKGAHTYGLHIAFDVGGNLWYTAAYGPGFTGTGGYLARFAAADLVSSGEAPIATAFQSPGILDAGGHILFNPPPVNLPIAQ